MRIAILEDEVFFRNLLADALNATNSVEVVAAFDAPQELLAQVAGLNVDAVILDLVTNVGQSPNGPDGGLAAGLAIRKILPNCGIVLLSNYADASVLTQVPLDQVGGWAYILKRRTDEIATVVSALNTVIAGETMLDPSIAEQGQPLNPSVAAGFTAHQLRVLALLASGASNAEIAKQLGVSVKSVEHAVTTINNALRIDSRDPALNPRVSAAIAYMRMLSAPGDSYRTTGRACPAP